MDIAPVASNLDLIAISINYLAFAGLVFYRYLNPKRWAKWLVKTSNASLAAYMITMFLLVMALTTVQQALEGGHGNVGNICVLMPGLLMLIAMAFVAKKTVEYLHGDDFLVPALYFLSIAQEIYRVAFSPGEIEMGEFLGLWMFGLVAILLGGRLIGLLLDTLFPKLERAHLEIVRKEYGPGAPKTLLSKDGWSSTGFFRGCGDFAGIIIAYALWMIVRYALVWGVS